MNVLLKIVRAEEQPHDLFCECHGNAPVMTLYRVQDENGERFDACLTTYLDMAEKGEVIATHEWEGAA